MFGQAHLSVQRCWKGGLGLCMLERSLEWFLQGTYSTSLDFDPKLSTTGRPGSSV
jgi:hypothetical protein